MRNLMKLKKMWIAFAVVFLSGIIIGVVGGIFFSAYFNPGKENEKRRQGWLKMHLLRRMSDELQLDLNQRTAVEKILHDMTKSISDIHAGQRPIIKEVIDKSFADIDKILTEDQKMKFVVMQQKMAETREKYRHERDRRKRGGPRRVPPVMD